jgi:hypothetical protein
LGDAGRRSHQSGRSGDAGQRTIPVVLFAAVAAWTGPLTAVALVSFAAARFWCSALTALAVLLVILGWLRPFPQGDGNPPGTAVSLTAMTQHVLYGGADPVCPGAAGGRGAARRPGTHRTHPGGGGAFRRLLDAGFTDAGRARLWAWEQPTWPVGGTDESPLTRHTQPLIRIDHVLVPQAAAVESVSSAALAGSDHAGVVARVRLPADSGR